MHVLNSLTVKIKFCMHVNPYKALFSFHLCPLKRYCTYIQQLFDGTTKVLLVEALEPDLTNNKILNPVEGTRSDNYNTEITIYRIH